jgi:hypothetical protein
VGVKLKRTQFSLLIFLSAFISILYFSLPAGSSTGATRIKYDVLTRGFRIGKAVSSLQVSNEEGQKTIRFANKTDVNVSFLWMGCNISTSEQATIKDGKLVSYSRREMKKGVDLSVKGRLKDDCFQFDICENGTRRSINIPCSSYDFTTMECPEATMSFKPDGRNTVRILDTEFMAVVERNYRLVREDNFKVDGREYHCRVIDFTDPHKSCRRWIGIDHGEVILFRQDGKSREGSYSVQATTLEQI